MLLQLLVYSSPLASASWGEIEENQQCSAYNGNETIMTWSPSASI